MANLAVRFNWKTQKLDEGIAALAARVKNLAPFSRKAAEYMVRSTKYRISRSKTAPDGTPWAPLRPVTEEMRGRILGQHDHRSAPKYQAGNILKDSGELMRSIDVDYATNSGFQISAAADYSSYMQKGVRRTGGWIKNKSIPARPFMGFSEENNRQIKKIMIAYLVGEL